MSCKLDAWYFCISSGLGVGVGPCSRWYRIIQLEMPLRVKLFVTKTKGWYVVIQSLVDVQLVSLSVSEAAPEHPSSKRISLQTIPAWRRAT